MTSEADVSQRLMGSTVTAMGDKASLRAWSKGLAPATPVESTRVAEAAARLIRDRGWTEVLTFLSMPGEVDLSELHRLPGVRFYVTRTPGRGPLTVHLLDRRLERHRFGYLQPAAGVPEVDPTPIEVGLVPGLLFDRGGGRLGHGMGYYDHLLGSLAHRPYLVGVTLERRLVEELPMTAGDVRMDALVTEDGYREVARFV
jgi:5-formyltetrahydrofolate cyclo-ligase